MQKSIKYISGIIAFLILLTACSRDPKSFEEELRQAFHGTRGFYYVKIPPALLTLVMKMTDDNDMIEFFGDARQVGIISFGEALSDGKNNELIRDLEQMLYKHDYEELIRITDAGRIVSMNIREENGKITELVAILSQNPGPVTGITLSGEIDIQKVVQLAAELDFEKLMQLPEVGRR